MLMRKEDMITEDVLKMVNLTQCSHYQETRKVRKMEEVYVSNPMEEISISNPTPGMEGNKK